MQKCSKSRKCVESNIRIITTTPTYFEYKESASNTNVNLTAIYRNTNKIKYKPIRFTNKAMGSNS